MKSEFPRFLSSNNVPRDAVSDSAQRSNDLSPQGSQLPTIAIIVPVRNEEKFIGGTLEALLGQEYPPARYEILVVDGRSTDRTREIVAKYA